MASLKYRVTVEFTVPADKPDEVHAHLESLKTIGEVVKVHASATKTIKE